jgi:hypothetical protein
MMMLLPVNVMHLPSVSKLTLSYSSQGNHINGIEDPTCDYKFVFEIDPSDMTVHQIFGVFEKVLMSMGFNESVIMSGACNLAFGDGRDTEKMNKLIAKYELNDIQGN